MRPVAKLVVTGLAVAGAFYVALTAYVTVRPPCSEFPMAEADSPDGLWTARVLRDSCHERPSRVVATLLNRQTRSETTLLTAPPTTTDIRLHWTSQGKLRIIFPRDLAVTEGAPKVGDVDVILDRQSAGG